ncbi:MAG TPA: hypothetical protein VL403_20685 [Candidatus Kryptonia bacterium]|nr:hypothetical protein [Candidatus Kryptonia bacterium]
MLQLETETKAWLRAPMVAHGVSIAEPIADRDKGIAGSGIRFADRGMHVLKGVPGEWRLFAAST